MTAGPIGATGPAAQPPAGEDQRLRRAAAELEGVFYAELLKALRETVPEGGAIDGGQAASIFTDMLDAHVAQLAAARRSGGPGEALYRQLRTLLPNVPAEPAS